MKKCNNCEFIGREFGCGELDCCNNSRSEYLHENVREKPVCEFYIKHFCSVENSWQAIDAEKAGI